MRTGVSLMVLAGKKDSALESDPVSSLAFGFRV